MRNSSPAGRTEPSRNTRRWRGPGGTPPVDSLPQHGQLSRCQPRGPVSRRRPGKATALQDLVIEAKALAIPEQQLDAVAAPAAKGEDRARAGILTQNLLGECGKAGHAP